MTPEERFSLDERKKKLTKKSLLTQEIFCLRYLLTNKLKKNFKKMLLAVTKLGLACEGNPTAFILGTRAFYSKTPGSKTIEWNENLGCFFLFPINETEALH